MTDTTRHISRASILFIVPALLGGPPALADGFTDFIDRLNLLPLDQRQAVVDSFLAATPAFPLTERDTIAHFVYSGNATSVAIPGDANGWNPGSTSMTRVQGTTLWYHTRAFEADARLDYKFVVNGTSWILDPRNPLQAPGGFGPNSELRMPSYVAAPEVQYDPAIPHGMLRDTTWSSVHLGNSRTIRIYTPPAYEASADSYSVIYVHDGMDYISLASAQNILDFLASRGKIRPLVGVFIPPVNRNPEYAGGSTAEFTRFMVEELVPYIDARYRTRRSATSRAVIGASNGGNISLWLGYHHPDVFGNVGAYSSNIVDSLRRGFASSPRKDLRLYLDIGTYDISVLIPLVRGFIPVLESKGYSYQSREYNEGHSWGSWRAHLDNSLEMFFGPTASTGDSWNEPRLPGYPELHQNYPNPFNPATSIGYRLPGAGPVSLSVYDMLGREVSVLVNESKAPGSYTVQFQAGGYASGVYVYRLVTPGSTRARRMTLTK
jgi:enterochelin esterase family protein